MLLFLEVGRFCLGRVSKFFFKDSCWSGGFSVILDDFNTTLILELGSDTTNQFFG